MRYQLLRFIKRKVLLWKVKNYLDELKEFKSVSIVKFQTVK